MIRKMSFTREALYQLIYLHKFTYREVAEAHKREFGIEISKDTIKDYMVKWRLGGRQRAPKQVIPRKTGLYYYWPTHPRTDLTGRVPLQEVVAESVYKIKYNPKRHRILFRDGDKFNCDPKNIKLIFLKNGGILKRMTRRARRRLRSHDFETVKTMVLDEEISPETRKRLVLRLVRGITETYYKRRPLTRSEVTFLRWIARSGTQGPKIGKIDWYKIPDRYRPPIYPWKWGTEPELVALDKRRLEKWPHAAPIAKELKDHRVDALPVDLARKIARELNIPAFGLLTHNRHYGSNEKKLMEVDRVGYNSVQKERQQQEAAADRDRASNSDSVRSGDAEAPNGDHRNDDDGSVRTPPGLSDSRRPDESTGAGGRV